VTQGADASGADASGADASGAGASGVASSGTAAPAMLSSLPRMTLCGNLHDAAVRIDAGRAARLGSTLSSSRHMSP